MRIRFDRGLVKSVERSSGCGRLCCSLPQLKSRKALQEIIKVFILSTGLCYRSLTPLGISVESLLMGRPFTKNQLFRFTSALAQNFLLACWHLYWVKPLYRRSSLALIGLFHWVVVFLPCCCLQAGLPIPSVAEKYFHMQYGVQTQGIVFAKVLLMLSMFPINEAGGFEQRPKAEQKKKG